MIESGALCRSFLWPPKNRVTPRELVGVPLGNFQGPRYCPVCEVTVFWGRGVAPSLSSGKKKHPCTRQPKLALAWYRVVIAGLRGRHAEYLAKGGTLGLKFWIHCDNERMAAKLWHWGVGQWGTLSPRILLSVQEGSEHRIVFLGVNGASSEHCRCGELFLLSTNLLNVCKSLFELQI